MCSSERTTPAKPHWYRFEPNGVTRPLPIASINRAHLPELSVACAGPVSKKTQGEAASNPADTGLSM